MKRLPAEVALICLIQVGVVVAGTLFTRLFLNIGLNHDLEARAALLPQKAVVAWFIRSHGAWFLLVPLFCSLWAAARATQHQGEPELDGANSLVISISTIALLALFLFSTMSPWAFMFRG